MELIARLNPGETIGDRVLKVNHAGEHGAVNIYRGQRIASRWRSAALRNELAELQRHEERHRAIFAEALRQRGMARCRSYHLCGVGGLTLGLTTGILGRASIAATTVAVEQVVIRHLEVQLRELRDLDRAAYEAVLSIVDEEKEHHRGASDEPRQGSFWPRIIRPVVSAVTETVIWLGMRL